MKKTFVIFSSIFTSFFAITISAADLLDVYQQALRSDPTFKEANAQWLAQRENLPISRASLLPQLSATGSVGRTYSNVEGGSFDIDDTDRHSKFYNNTTSFSLSLSQPIFNFSNWASLRGAGATVKQAEAQFASDAQDLMTRVATAYFNVLQAQDVLRFTRENKKAVGEVLRQQRQKYAVGLIPITDVNDAQASYDSVIAQEIAAQNDLQDQEEKLQEITSLKYSSLNTLKANLPLVTPDPANIERWVRSAEQQNYTLLAARYAAIAAREDVSVQEGGHFPTLNATGGYDYGYNSNASNRNQLSRDKSLSAGLSVNIPIFQGGAVSARTQQSGYLYQKAVATQEKTHRSTVSNTRQAYLGVMSGISKIKADRQLVKSKLSSLQSRRNSYSAGLRTIVDVLQAESDLYDAEKTYAIDQYNYILQTLTLKQQAGILSADDLAKVNRWLEKSGKLIDTSMQKDDIASNDFVNSKYVDNYDEVNHNNVNNLKKQKLPPIQNLPSVQEQIKQSEVVPQQNVANANVKPVIPETKIATAATTSTAVPVTNAAKPVNAMPMATAISQPIKPIVTNKPVLAAPAPSTSALAPVPSKPMLQPVTAAPSAPSVGAVQPVTTTTTTTTTSVAASVAKSQPVVQPVVQQPPVPAQIVANGQNQNIGGQNIAGQNPVSQNVVQKQPMAVNTPAVVPNTATVTATPHAVVAQPIVSTGISQSAQPVAVVTPKLEVSEKPVEKTAHDAPKASTYASNIPVVSKKKHLTYAEKYLKHVNSAHYTIELFTNNDKQKVINFAARNKLQDRTVLLTNVADGKTSYSLIYGEYENSPQAEFAAKRIHLDVDIDAKVLQFSDIKN